MPPREGTPGSTTIASTAAGIGAPGSFPAASVSPIIPQKRVLDDDYTPRPSVPSPLNPDVSRGTPKPTSSEDMPPKRTKKESLKKRESKGGYVAEGKSSASESKKRDSQVHEPPADVPLRYKQPPPKPGDFHPSRGPAFTHHRTVPEPNNEGAIEFYETSDQYVPASSLGGRP